MAQGRINALLQKLQIILSAETEISRLEKDLVKDYLRELYALVDELKETTAYFPKTATHATSSMPRDLTPTQPVPPENRNEPSLTSRHEQSPAPLHDDPPAPVKEAQAAPEQTPIASNLDIEKLEEEGQKPEAGTRPLIDAEHHSGDAVWDESDKTDNAVQRSTTEDSNGHTTFSSEEQLAPTIQNPSAEVKDNLKDIVGQKTHIPEQYQKLFAKTSNNHELSERLSRAPIKDLQKAFGINDKLLVINHLFDGDLEHFNETLDVLNSKYSLEEAKSYLLRYIVDKYGWLDEGKQDEARDFIKLVERRYLI